MKITFYNRLVFAWKAFNLESFELLGPFEDRTGTFHMDVTCDNELIFKNCNSNKIATSALYRKKISLLVDYVDSYFICEDCKNHAIGKNEKNV